MKTVPWLLALGLIGSVLSSGRELQAANPSPALPPAPAERARHFDVEIAPLLARHCVECHGPSAKKGRLDLSRKGLAFEGGKSGAVIVPGKAAESLVWKMVESDEMPEDRPPLSLREKTLLRQWIEAGAIWSADETAPLTYLEESRRASIWLRRLTVPEYIETVRSAVGVEVALEARRILPPDLRADGFQNTAYNLSIDLGHVEAYAELARLIVNRMDPVKFAGQFTPRQELTESSMRELISGMGKWLLRGPLEEHEVTTFLRVPTAVAEQGGHFGEAVKFLLEAMLQSPRFIYRMEDQRGDGTVRRVNDYELASRLSYILWGAPPDPELMRAAEAGELSNRSHLEAQVSRMLHDPRAVERSARFIYEWLSLDRLDTLQPNSKRFPKWDARLAPDMREETLAFFKEVAWEQNRPLAELMNAQVTHATPWLAEYYGLAPNLTANLSRDALQALYTFEEGGGDTIRDVSGASEPLDLKIEDAAAVQWKPGGLIVKAHTRIASAGPPARLIEAVKQSQAITLEAWIMPADARQKGPARIVTLSGGASQRNFTLGQDGNRYEVRLRTQRTDANGLPRLIGPSEAAERRLTHLAYTRDAAGQAKFYLNGEERSRLEVPGELANWSGEFELALANETTKDRGWRGTFHQVAIYSRVLSAEEIRARGRSLSRYDLAAVPSRGGLLTQAGVLTVGGDEASTVARGLFVLLDLLGGKIESAPPGVDTTPVPPKAGLSHRAIAETRLNNQSCGGCHAKFEPFSFGLSKYDGLGAFHEKDEHGNKLQDDGEIFLPGQEQPIAFKSSAELMNVLAGSAAFRQSITRKLTQFALGRPLVEADAPQVDKIHQAAQNGNGTYASLITAIVLSDLVRMTGTEKN